MVEEPVEVPFRDVPADTLRSIAEEFCTRDGTDYGESEMALPQKIELLMRQFERGEAHLVFEASTETLSILSRREVEALRRSQPG